MICNSHHFEGIHNISNLLGGIFLWIHRVSWNFLCHLPSKNLSSILTINQVPYLNAQLLIFCLWYYLFELQLQLHIELFCFKNHWMHSLYYFCPKLLLIILTLLLLCHQYFINYCLFSWHFLNFINYFLSDQFLISYFTLYFPNHPILIHLYHLIVLQVLLEFKFLNFPYLLNFPILHRY